METLTKEFEEVFRAETPGIFEKLTCMGTLPEGVVLTKGILVKIAKATRKLRADNDSSELYVLTEEDIDDILEIYDGPIQEGTNQHAG